MLSPYSKGLFRRAISQCGVALSPWALQKDPMALTKKVQHNHCHSNQTVSMQHHDINKKVLLLFLQIARKVGCWRTDTDEMISCLKMSDPVGLTLAGKIDVFLILGKGERSWNNQKPEGPFRASSIAAFQMSK